MEVLEKNGEIVFLRKLREGAAAESYGLHVAGLAGLPQTVLERARALLERIRAAENAIRDILPSGPDGKTPSGGGELSANGEVNPPPASPASVLADVFVRELSSIDINSLTPLEALNHLQKLKDMLVSASVLPLYAPHGEKQRKTKRSVSGSLSLFDGL
jgi:DNA mismatch repair protein MutS